jgi:nucleotide-binding universal stress UspA family protein
MKPAIMVPLDGSAFAEAAIGPAIRLAERDGLSIQLVTVWAPILPLYEVSGQLETWEREAHARHHVYMGDMATKLEEVSGRPVSVKFVKGRPAEVLPTLAEPDKVKLVVMATHARGPVARASLGSVADQVVRKGSVPVMLIRPEEDVPLTQLAPAPPFRRVLVPLDGSDLAETALQRSLLSGDAASIEATLLRVVAFPMTLIGTDEGLLPVVDDDLLEAERKASQKYLDGVAERLAPWGWQVTTALVEDTSPAAGIVQYAEANGIDLIAMATHGRGGAQRLLLGSVADKVIRSSRVPVLLSHPERAPSPWLVDVERLAGQVVGMP